MSIRGAVCWPSGEVSTPISWVIAGRTSTVTVPSLFTSGVT